MIDALTSLCDQAVLDIPVEALRIIDESIVPLAGAIGDFGVGISAEAGKVVFVTAFDDSEIVVPASYALDWRTGTVKALFADTVIGDELGIGVDVFAGMDRNVWAASTTVLACISVLLPFPEVSLLFGSEACSCWSTAS